MLILPVLMFRPLCAYFVNRTTPLKNVIYVDGSHTRSALNFYLQRDAALGVCRKSMFQGFALKEKSAKFQTALVSIPQILIHLSIPQFLIHLLFVSSVDVGVGTGDSTDTPVLNAMANPGECSSSLNPFKIQQQNNHYLCISGQWKQCYFLHRIINDETWSSRHKGEDLPFYFGEEKQSC